MNMWNDRIRVLWIVLGLFCGMAEKGRAETIRPNILFLIADDWSAPHASILGDQVVKTPTFDRMAKEGVLFDHAFASSPSCTPSRFAIASGRSHLQLKGGANLGGSLQADTKVYHDMLEEEGYHVGFMKKGGSPSGHIHRKKDPFGVQYKSFDEFLKKRKEGTPFSFWFGSGDPHRPYEKGVGVQSGINPDEVQVPDGLPDTDVVREDMCDYYWEVQRFDREAGKIIAQLEAMGELENTIVVVSSDNGMPFPRCKATLYDMGTHVPLAVRWGNTIKGGRLVSDFVMLFDLAPMVLEAAGIEVPEEMTGNSIMPLLLSDKSGKIDLKRTSAITGIERHSYNHPSRAIRTKDFLFIRKYNPTKWRTGDGNWPSDERDFSFNIDPSPSKVLLKKSSNNPELKPFFDRAFKHQQEEELYDLRKDPGQIRNLAADPEYAQIKKGLIRDLERKLNAIDDPRMSGNESVFFEDDKVRKKVSKKPKETIKGYTPMLLEGWTVHVDRKFSGGEPELLEQVLDLLKQKLAAINAKISLKAADVVHRIPIVVGNNQRRGSRGEYHVSEEWLKGNGFDPKKSRCVEFDNADFFIHGHKQQPMMVAHELAHGYHHNMRGFDDPEIKNIYDQAMAEKLYDSVKRRTGGMTSAYAKNDHLEYFAEGTEAFLGENDFYPFNRKDLEQHDVRLFNLMTEIWE